MKWQEMVGIVCNMHHATSFYPNCPPQRPPHILGEYQKKCLEPRDPQLDQLQVWSLHL